jgi:hypothetical protein
MEDAAGDLEQLLAYCSANSRVCPQPQRWNELYQMLPETHRKGMGFEPPVPLILAAWWEASDRQKKERLKVHLLWANDHGALATIGKFLRSLAESDWHHE